jgi:protein-disulfide isomerase
MLFAMNRNRLLLLGAAAVVAIAVVVVVIAFAGGSGSKNSAATTTTAASGGSSSGDEATATFAGVPQHGDTLGKASAATTLYVFEDPQCPYCRQWNIDTLPTVVQNYVRDGRVKLVYRGIEVIGPNSLVGMSAIYAAARQNKAWQLAEALYERQGSENSGWITIPVVKQAAKEVGADPAKLVADMKSEAVISQISAGAKQAAGLGINGTPTFGIQRPLGTIQQLQISSLEPDGFTPALDAALS